VVSQPAMIVILNTHGHRPEEYPLVVATGTARKKPASVVSVKDGGRASLQSRKRSRRPVLVPQSTATVLVRHPPSCFLRGKSVPRFFSLPLNYKMFSSKKSIKMFFPGPAAWPFGYRNGNLGTSIILFYDSRKQLADRCLDAHLRT
jgi:hypothetical protein